MADRRGILLITLLAACGPEEEPSTFKLGFRLGPDTGEAIEPVLNSAWLEVAAVRLQACPEPDGKAPDVPPHTVGLDLTERPRRLVEDATYRELLGMKGVQQVSSRAIDAPRGARCGMEVLFSGPLFLVGEADGVSFDVQLQLPHLTFAVPQTFGAGVAGAEGAVGAVSLTVELGREGWLRPLADLVALGEPVVLLPGDEGHDAWVQRVLFGEGGAGQGTGLYVTANANAPLAEEEHAAGAVGAFEPLDGALLP